MGAKSRFPMNRRAFMASLATAACVPAFILADDMIRDIAALKPGGRCSAQDFGRCKFRGRASENMHPVMMLVVTNLPLEANTRSRKDFVIMSPDGA